MCSLFGTVILKGRVMRLSAALKDAGRSGYFCSIHTTLSAKAADCDLYLQLFLIGGYYLL
jgi:hypothetical protein